MAAGLELALPSEEAQQAAFVRVDVDGEGTLPFAGLCAAARGCWPQGAWGKPELVLAYNAARDGDGYVGRKGLIAFFRHLDEPMGFHKGMRDLEMLEIVHTHIEHIMHTAAYPS